jgi:amino acid permease
MKTVVGAGILALPYTISQLGLALGIGLFVLIIAVMQFNSVLLLKAKNLSRHSNYSSIAFHIFRNKGAQIVCNLAIFLNNAGICIAELTIIKQILFGLVNPDPLILHDSDVPFYKSQKFFVLIIAVVLFPFTLLKKMENLRFLAFFGIGGITLFVATFIVIFFLMMSSDIFDWTCSGDGMQPVGDSFMKMIVVIPNILLALGFQMNFFPIYKGDCLII